MRLKLEVNRECQMLRPDTYSSFSERYDNCIVIDDLLAFSSCSMVKY
jgi:hypothetical protein